MGAVLSDDLERILAAIAADAESEAAGIIDAAQKEADGILSQAKKEADAESLRIVRDAEAKAARLRDTLSSSVELASRQQLLAEKQSLIAATLRRARRAFIDLPAERYFDLLSRMILQRMPKGESVLLLSDRDRKRMPQGFLVDLNRRIDGSSVQLGASAADIEAGFLLRAGNIEENCSVDALFAAQVDEMSDIIRAVLFE